MAARTTDICLLTLALFLVACQRPPMDNAGAETVPAAVQPGGLDAEAGDGWHAHDEAGDPGEPLVPRIAQRVVAGADVDAHSSAAPDKAVSTLASSSSHETSNFCRPSSSSFSTTSV